MAVNKRLLQGAAGAAGGLVPSEHFGVVLYEGDGSSSHSINGGKFGAGAYTNGSNSNLTYPKETIDINKSHSISGWVYLTQLQNEDMLFCNHDNNVRLNSNYSVKYRRNLVNTAYDIDSTTTLSTNTWYHIVTTFDTTNGMVLYINGSSEGTNSYTGNVSAHSSDYSLMYRADNSSQRTKGKIDQVRIFTKALSLSEVSTLYAETAATVESLDPLSEDTTDTLQVLGDSSCIATYRFENDEVDLSGNYDGTGTAIQYAAGRYGQAASFNGSASYVSIAGSSFDLTSMSVSAWFKTSDTSQNYQTIFNNYSQTSGQDRGWYVRYETGGNIRLRGWSSSNSQVLDTLISTTINQNEWYHIVVTINSTQVKVYKNNSQIGSTQSLSSSIGYSGTGGFPTIGSYRTSSIYIDNYFKGEIDQVRVFNKELSASEVTTLYNENSLVASYRFEGNANDDTRNYDGTPTNVTFEYGLGFTPDLVWAKHRNHATAHSHNWADSTRGGTKIIYSNTNDAQQTISNSIQTFDTGGFTVGNSAAVNDNGINYVAWCWKANGGTTSSNTDGTITSTVQANQDAGFSIVTYTGNLTANASIGHGLGVKPSFIITKSTSNTESWEVWSSALNSGGVGQQLRLNSVNAAFSAADYYSTPDTSNFYVGPYTGCNGNGYTYVSYCFAEVAGFSKFGSYVGNGSTNGPIVETGFEPAFVMFKATGANTSWVIIDNKRGRVGNPRNEYLFANSSGAAGTNYNVLSFFSNGFQVVDSATTSNANGGTFIYMAFAADPDTEQPTVAKSFSTVAYTGTGSTPQSITGLGFQPNLVWIKVRSAAGYAHVLFDSIRGATKRIYPSETAAENSNGQLSSFDSDGFTFSGGGSSNVSGQNMIAWSWKADDNEPTINTEGSIDSLVSANANAGFSIVSYTGNGSTATQTIGHGLSQAPELILQKAASTVTTYGTNNWVVGGTLLGAGGYMFLNNSAAKGISTDYWSNTIPTASVFSVSGGPISTRVGNELNGKFINYCFHSVSGYSKIGSYSGTGSSQTITTGFQPDWILTKRTDTTDNWRMYDSVRQNAQPFDEILYPNLNNAEEDNDTFVTGTTSTGFTLGTGNGSNASGGTYIYMAFKIN